MINQMTMQRITLYREGFTPIVIRKVTLVDESYFYEMLAYSHPHYLHERWEKVALSNEQVESQIEKYAQQERAGGWAYAAPCGCVEGKVICLRHAGHA